MTNKVPHKTPLDFIPEAILFDVFGTVFDCRNTIISHLEQVISSKATSLHTDGVTPAPNTNTNTTIKPDLTTPEAIKRFCSTFADEWEKYYVDYIFTKDRKSKGNDTAVTDGQQSQQLQSTEDSSYMTLDTVYLQGLTLLLSRYGLSQLFTPSEMHSLSRIWHDLRPWPDSKQGIKALRELSIVSPLSNGNIRLLVDLQKNSGVFFDTVLSAQLWTGYKPEKRIYVGACEILGIGGKQQWDEYVEECKGKGEKWTEEEKWRKQEKRKVAMVAAHLFDLRAAKSYGMTTIFVHRPEEAEQGVDEYIKNGEDWIDMWVTSDEGGILEVARRLKAFKER